MPFQRPNVGQYMVLFVAMSIAPQYHLSAKQEETDSTTVRQWLSQVRSMQRFLMLSVVALIGVSHAVNLSDAVAESERWERIRHVAVEAIPRINAGGLVAKRALLGVHCHRFGARCGGSEFTLGDDSSDVIEMVVCVF